MLQLRAKRPKLLQSLTLLRTHSETQHVACSVSCTLACLQNTQHPAHEAAENYSGSFSSCTTCQPLHPHHSTKYSKTCAPTPHMHLQSGVEWPKLGRFAKFLFLRDRKEHTIMQNGSGSQISQYRKSYSPKRGCKVLPKSGDMSQHIARAKSGADGHNGRVWASTLVLHQKMAHASNHSCP